MNMRLLKVLKISDLLSSAHIIFLIISPVISASLPLNATNLPTIALIPDAWHSPVHYLELTNHLSQASFNVISHRLPSCDAEFPVMQSTAIDAASIRQDILIPLMNGGKTVVLIMHAYGGCPGSVAAKGFTMSERRAAGKPGGIIGMIMICGIIARTSRSLRSLFVNGRFDPWVIDYVSSWRSVTTDNDLYSKQNDGQLGVDKPLSILYNDVPPAVAARAAFALRNQSIQTFETPTGNPAWSDAFYDGRRSYVQTLVDKAIPLQRQDSMIQRSFVDWNVASFSTGHSPFLSQPEELSKWIVTEIARLTTADVGGGTATA